MDCNRVRDQILSWFGTELECRESGNQSVIIALPLLAPNGDAIEVGIESLPSGGFGFSDLGETHAALFLQGITIDEGTLRGEEFSRILADYQIEERGDELAAIAEGTELPERLFDFAHAIQSALALRITVQPKRQKRDFPALVAKFFGESRTEFELMAAPVNGRTGAWRFNFRLNTVREAVLVKAITATSRLDAIRTTERSVFEIQDVRGAQPRTSVAVVLDDEGYRQSYWSRALSTIFPGYEIDAYAYAAQRDRLITLAQSYRRPN